MTDCTVGFLGGMDLLCPFRSALLFTSKWGVDYGVLCILGSGELPTHAPPSDIYYLFLESSLKWESMTWLASLVTQLGGSLETSVWSTACNGVVRLHFKPTLIDAVHYTTQRGICTDNWIRFWGLNSAVFNVLNSFVVRFNFTWVWTFDFITFDFTNSRFICMHHPWPYNSGFCQFCMQWKFEYLNWLCKLLHKVYTDSKLGWEPVFFISFFYKKIQQISKITQIYRLDRNKIFQNFPFFWGKKPLFVIASPPTSLIWAFIIICHIRIIFLLLANFHQI